VDTLDLADVMAMWPIFLGFITLVVVLAKMHAEIDTLKEKVKTLFNLFNSRRGDD